jgi:DNA segregation ATPase FtsK/SpoIIIE, S-DNA-T family
MNLPNTALLNRNEEEEILELRLNSQVRKWAHEIKTPASVIASTFLKFGRKVIPKQSTEGALVSQHEFTPETGYLLRRFFELDNEVALALGVDKVRMYRHASHTSFVVEVPNKIRRTIYLRDVLENSKYYDCSGQMPIALGQRPNGTAVVIDLAQAPHILIGGCTGSGKSVALHSIITSLVMRYGPAQLQLALVDPKRMEMNVYKDLPHLAMPVVDEPHTAVMALEKLKSEITSRTRILEKARVTCIEDYNSLGVGFESLPRIVFVIDELADLIFACGKQAEEPLARCAALGRAVGVHLIVATQRPEAKVVTGLIKANFPTRLGLRVVDKINSRIILDQSGAETLLGRGDALLMDPTSTKLERIHCAYVGREEINRVVNYYLEQIKGASS